MNLLALSGSVRASSTNRYLLRALSEVSPPGVVIEVFDDLSRLPVFSPDAEEEHTPRAVEDFCDRIRRSDGLIVSSPEYVRSIPGGLKNAIDWLVSRDEIVHKPVVLAHASHRGDDLLRSLRLVLRTVTTRFDEHHFLRIPLVARSPDDAQRILREPENRARMRAFIQDFAGFVGAGEGLPGDTGHSAVPGR